jgi:hypothetical protein
MPRIPLTFINATDEADLRITTIWATVVYSIQGALSPITTHPESVNIPPGGSYTIYSEPHCVKLVRFFALFSRDGAPAGQASDDSHRADRCWAGLECRLRRTSSADADSFISEVSGTTPAAIAAAPRLIESLNLSKETLACLHRSKITTVDELLRHSLPALAKKTTVTKAALAELLEAAQEQGLSFSTQ